MPARAILALLIASLLVGSGCQPTATIPEVQPPGEATPRYLVGAHYYSWFPDAFRGGYLRGLLDPPQEPEIGEYSSWEIETAEQHIALAAEYGIDFFTLDFWPTSPASDVRLQLFLEARNIEDIQFCIFYETGGLGFTEYRTVINFTEKVKEKFLADLERIAEEFMGHPQYLRIDGRPVLILYVTRTMTGQYAEALKAGRALFKSKGYDVYLIADEIYWDCKEAAPNPVSGETHNSTEPQVARIELFDAITAYNFYTKEKEEYSGYGSETTFIEDVIELTQTFKDSTEGRIPVIPSVIPGYNDRGHRLKENHFALPRRWGPPPMKGNFFSHMLDDYALKFLDERAPLLLVTSWNEWNEDTAIEPVKPMPETSEDKSGEQEYTQGYPYGGFGTYYLKVLRDRTVAVSGQLTNSENKPLPRLPVGAWRGHDIVAVDFTNSQGQFHLSRLNLKPGTYRVGALFSEAQEVRVNARRTTHLELTSDVPSPEKPAPAMDLKAKFRSLDAALGDYVSDFPSSDYEILERGSFQYHLDDISDPLKESLRKGQPWEPEVQERLREFLKPGDRAVDVGAHIGIHAQLMGELVGASGEVYAFEPQRKLYRELLKNLQLNKLNNVIPLRFALDSHTKFGHMHQVEGLAESLKKVGEGGEEVELRALDSFHLKNLRLIKIDAPEYESAILEGARETILRDKPILLVEIHSAGDYSTLVAHEKHRVEFSWGTIAGLGYRSQQLSGDNYLATAVEDGPDRIWLDIGTKAARRHLKDGFSQDEFEPNGCDYVWSSGSESTLYLPLKQVRPGDYVVGLRGGSFGTLAPLRTEFVVNGESVGYLDIGTEWSGLELTVPSGLLQPGPNTVELRYGQTTRPSHVLEGFSDNRALSLRFDKFWLTPKALDLPSPEPKDEDQD